MVPPYSTPVATRVRGDLTPELVSTSIWTDEMVTSAGIPIVDVPFVTIGGGMGSFAMVDYLRIAGVPASDIKVLTTSEYPWENYEYLTGVAQLPPEYRIRSDASSMPDNIWGFPSYAVRAAFSARSVGGFVRPLWNVLTENILSDYWTPLAGQVFAGMRREANRIGYWESVATGQARMVRRRAGGGYFAVLTPKSEFDPNRDVGHRVAYRCVYVHLAVGYPSVRFLPDLRTYRQRHGDSYRFVNSYEPHEHVYHDLVKRGGGTVLVRGGGITASAILHRLFNDRDQFGPRTQVLHLLRTYVDSAHGPSVFMRRRGGNGWAYQGFNWPKSSWGGQLKQQLERLDDEQRRQLWQTLKGSTTPRRKVWQEQIRRGSRDGYYHTLAGEIDHVEPGPAGGVSAFVRLHDDAAPRKLDVDFIVDATGLVGDIAEHRLLADLLTHSGAGRNFLGRLAVDSGFELAGCRSGEGRMFAAGATTEGSYYAPTDSLLGLQYAAHRICDELARAGFCRRIGVARSTAQWWKWMRNRTP